MAPEDRAEAMDTPEAMDTSELMDYSEAMEVMSLRPDLLSGPPASFFLACPYNSHRLAKRDVLVTYIHGVGNTSVSTVQRHTCFPVVVPDDPSASKWSFILSSEAGPDVDILLPMPEPFRIIIGYVKPSEASRGMDTPRLLMRISRVPLGMDWQIVDPINPLLPRIPEQLTVGRRYLHNPVYLRLGCYCFYVHMSTQALDKGNPQTVALQRRIASTIPFHNGEKRWRPIGITLGQGTFGKVELLRGLSSGQLVACKTVLPIRHALSIMDIERRGREREVMEALDHHAIVKFYGMLTPDQIIEGPNLGRIESGTSRFLMQACHGSLSELLTVEGLSPSRFWLDFAQQGSSAIAYVHGIQTRHRQTLMHRDLKPENFCYDLIDGGEAAIDKKWRLSALQRNPRFRFYMVDFGGAKVQTPFMTPGTGTMLYLAPEGYSFDYGCPVDVFAFGFTLIHVLAEDIFKSAYINLTRRTDIQFLAAPEQSRIFQNELRGYVASVAPAHPVWGAIYSMIMYEPGGRPSAATVSDFFASLGPSHEYPHHQLLCHRLRRARVNQRTAIQPGISVVLAPPRPVMVARAAALTRATNLLGPAPRIREAPLPQPPKSVQCEAKYDTALQQRTGPNTRSRARQERLREAQGSQTTDAETMSTNYKAAAIHRKIVKPAQAKPFARKMDAPAPLKSKSKFSNFRQIKSSAAPSLTAQIPSVKLMGTPSPRSVVALKTSTKIPAQAPSSLGLSKRASSEASAESFLKPDSAPQSSTGSVLENAATHSSTNFALGTKKDFFDIDCINDIVLSTKTNIFDTISTCDLNSDIESEEADSLLPLPRLRRLPGRYPRTPNLSGGVLRRSRASTPVLAATPPLRRAVRTAGRNIQAVAESLLYWLEGALEGTGVGSVTKKTRELIEMA